MPLWSPLAGVARQAQLALGCMLHLNGGACAGLLVMSVKFNLQGTIYAWILRRSMQ